jgi:aminoglycoside phosphotransferase (APT) family kinase protein
LQSKTKNKKSREQIAKMAQRAFNGISLAPESDAVQELTEGWYNAAYLVRLANGQEVVLKIAPPPDVEIMAYEQNIMRTEVNAMRRVAQNPAIPVPEIYCYETTHELCDADYFFMAKLKGENYDHVKKSLALEAIAQIDRQIGAIIREINGFTGTTFGYEGNPKLRAKTWKAAFIKIMEAVLADGQRKNAAYGYSVREIREVYLAYTSALDAVTTPHLVHWDGWNPNFFVLDGQVTGLLDFERALWADPLMEAQFRPLALGELPDSLRGYGKTTFTPEEDVRNHLYTLHLALVMVTECYYRDYDTDEVNKFALNLLSMTLNSLKKGA